MNACLYNNKYRIESSRLKNWDYGRNASYFATICTRDRENFFGEILGGEMQLSEIKEAEKYWREIPDQFPYIVLDEFIVMPNHLHGIVIIDKPEDGAIGGRDAMNRVSTVVTAGDGHNSQQLGE